MPPSWGSLFGGAGPSAHPDCRDQVCEWRAVRTELSPLVTHNPVLFSELIISLPLPGPSRSALPWPAAIPGSPARRTGSDQTARDGQVCGDALETGSSVWGRGRDVGPALSGAEGGMLVQLCLGQREGHPVLLSLGQREGHPALLSLGQREGHPALLSLGQREAYRSCWPGPQPQDSRLGGSPASPLCPGPCSPCRVWPQGSLLGAGRLSAPLSASLSRGPATSLASLDRPGFRELSVRWAGSGRTDEQGGAVGPLHP